MFKDLKYQGFNVRILKERVWNELSKNIAVMPVSTKIQDTILLIRIKDDIFINLNGLTLFLCLNLNLNLIEIL